MSGHGAPAAAAPAAPARRSFGETKSLEIDKIFREMIRQKGSDLHMQVGRPAIIRVRGSLVPVKMEPISKEKMEALLMPMMDERLTNIFWAEGGSDFSHVVEHEGEKWRF